VRVVDDEVFFTLVAPGAQNVYLVGDFNNWNPTVERMPQSGDVFEISLYLVAGSYRYKFVVDGKWIVDPDNPNSDPSRGSPLVLVEKPAGLVLKTEDLEEEKKSPPIRPALRYIGDFRVDDGDFDSDQQIDVSLRVAKGKLRSCFLFKTVESTWDLSEADLDVTVDRGFVETEGAGVVIRAFDNDSVWTSTGPLGLVGNAGVYDYNAGFGRTGFAVEYPFSEAIKIRGMYADYAGSGELPLPSADIGAAVIFAGSGESETTAYSFVPGREGSDLFGFEAFIDADGYQLGYARRHDYGLNQGRKLEITRADSLIATTLFGTREGFTAAEYWVRIKKYFGLNAAFGFGRGEATLYHLDRGFCISDVDGLESLKQTPRPDVVDFETELLSSDRYVAALDYNILRLLLSASWERTSFDFKPGVYEEAAAAVHRSSVWAAYNTDEWHVGIKARYTEQDYGDSPPGLIVDSPSRNFWLDGRDELDVGDIAALGRAYYSDVVLTAAWAASGSAGDGGRTGGEEWWPPSAVSLEAGITAEYFFKTYLYRHARLNLEKVFRYGLFLMLDGRIASYGPDLAGEDKRFADGYAEFGYRRPRYEINLGYGFDPVIFDLVLNEYDDIGRSEYLRQSLDLYAGREDYRLVTGRLLELEKSLQAENFLKLECVIRF
jgi:hypothetical protein